MTAGMRMLLAYIVAPTATMNKKTSTTTTHPQNKKSVNVFLNAEKRFEFAMVPNA